MYGILKSAINTGLESELQCVFVAPIMIYSNQPSYVQDMMSLKRRASSQNVQRWEIEANLNPTNDSPAYLIHSTTFGHHGTFHVRMPQVANLQVSTNNDIVTSAAFSQGTDTLNLSNNLVAGEFINFEGYDKVYLVIGEGTAGVGVRITPRLFEDIPINTKVIVGKKVTMIARYDTNTRIGITYTDGVLSDPGSVKLIEAL